jgi:hypothetical protein
LRVPSYEEAYQLTMRELIDRFNQPCGTGTCRHTSRQVNDSWCEAHRRYYRELKQRQEVAEHKHDLNVAESSAVSRVARYNDACQVGRKVS